MAVESATYISQLVDTNPVVGDPVGEGDDHLRMIKEVLKTNFSGINGSGTTAVTSSAAELNLLDGLTTLAQEGTAILSTSETGTTKFLRVDGDDSCSWQVPPDTNTTYTAGDGLDLTGTAFSTDLKSAGGLAIDSTELTVDFTSDNSWTGSQRATTVTDNDGSYDMNGGQNFVTTPSGSTTITFTNIANGQSGFIKLINSGGETISLHANSKVDANLATTVSTAGTYLLSYFSDGTDVWLTNSAIYA